MLTTATSSEIVIDADAATIYDFVTRPDNWVGTHPVTRWVKGETAEPAGVGTTWREGIQRDGDDRLWDVTWLSSVAVPGHIWVIETDELGLPGVRCRIVYTLTPEGRGTRFRRDMTVLIGDEVGLPAELRAAFEATGDDSGVHDDYLSNVKAALES